MQGFELVNVNHRLYVDMLDYISQRCKDFEVVELKMPGGYIVTTDIKKQLDKYCIGYKYVKKWNGTQGAGLMHVYKCTLESINVLKKYENFFDLDNSDVSFYTNGRPMLYTTCHERYIQGIYDYWDSFFEKKIKSWGDYKLEFFPYFDDKYDDSDKDRSKLKQLD